MTYGRLAEAIAAAAPHAPRRPAAAGHRPNHLATVDAVGDFYGAGGDMLPPTRAEAMSVPAMARARHIIATAARLPLAADPGTYTDTALIDQPDPARTRAAVLSDTIDDLLFDGYSVWRVLDRYRHGRPRHAEHIALDRLARDPDGRWSIDDRPAADADLIWFEGPHPGVRHFAGRALRAAVRLDRAYAATASNPAVALELHQTSADVLTDDEVADLVQSARDAVADRGVLFTNAALELRTHAAIAENLLISGRQAAAVDIARTVGLPAPVIDAYPAGASSTYANSAARLREARDLGASAYSHAITSRLSLDDVLPRGVSVNALWDDLMRESFADRMAGYAAAQAAGVYTAEECRELERARPNREG